MNNSPQLGPRFAENLADLLNQALTALQPFAKGTSSRDVSPVERQSLEALEGILREVLPNLQKLGALSPIQVLRPSTPATLLGAAGPALRLDPDDFLIDLGVDVRRAFSDIALNDNKANREQLQSALSAAQRDGKDDSVYKCLAYLYVQGQSVTTVEIADKLSDPARSNFFKYVADDLSRKGPRDLDRTGYGQQIFMLMRSSIEHASPVLQEEIAVQCLFVYFRNSEIESKERRAIVQACDQLIAGKNTTTTFFRSMLSTQLTPPLADSTPSTRTLLFGSIASLRETFGKLITDEVRSNIIPWFSRLGEKQDIETLEKLAKDSPSLAEKCQRAIGDIEVSGRAGIWKKIGRILDW